MIILLYYAKIEIVRHVLLYFGVKGVDYGEEATKTLMRKGGSLSHTVGNGARLNDYEMIAFGE